jgi:16S rRNA G966 N2-methylase RsmD
MSTDAQHHPIPDDATLHKNIFRIQTKADVFQKYEVIDVFVGSGSMGSVSKVRY